MRITFTIPGEPVQWVRAGRAGRATFTERKQADHKQQVRWRAKAAGVRTLLGPVAVEMVFMYEPPKSWPKIDREQAITTGQRKITTPDCDNLVKQILDALEGVAYDNDRQVTYSPPIKMYGPVAQTIVTIYPDTDPIEIYAIPGATGPTEGRALV